MRLTRWSRLVGVAVTVAAVAGVGLAGVRSQSGEAAPDAAAKRVIAAAKEQLGDGYEWGGNGPDKWDCSGLTSTLWREIGGVDSIPRVSQAQAAWAIPVSAQDALPGDLVFFDDPVSHVSLYLGNGRVIDASSARGKVVIREVWTTGLVTYGRVPRRSAPPVRIVRGGRGIKSKPITGGTARAPARVKEDGRLNAVPRLGQVSRYTPRPVAARFAAAARSTVGATYAVRGRGPTYDAAGLVAAAWRRSGGGAVPTTAAELERRTRRVRVRDVTPGDLVLYGSPAVHVGIYVGGGQMVDASKMLRRVVLRPVFRSDTVRFARIAATQAAAPPRVRKTPKPARVTNPAKPPVRRTTAGATKARKPPTRVPASKPPRRPRGR